MPKPKTWEDPARSFDEDWPPTQPITLTDLVAGGRAVERDFTTWCCASGHDANDPDARLMFECFTGLRQARGPRRIELTAAPVLEGFCAVAAPNKSLAQINNSGNGS
jgi:hypothetical protein